MDLLFKQKSKKNVINSSGNLFGIDKNMFNKIPIQFIDGVAKYQAFGYVKEKNKWEKTISEEFLGEQNLINVMTLNVWFDKFKLVERANHLISILKKENIDIVCLQEINKEYLDLLLNNAWIQDNFYISDNEDMLTITEYGVLILSKFSVFNFYCLNLRSIMDRKSIILHIKTKNENLFISSIHLESLNNSEKRIFQLKQIFNFLSLQNSDVNIICGDFNFDDVRSFHQKTENNKDLLEPIPEEQFLNEYCQNKYIDVYKKMNKDDGYTYDTEENKMLKVKMNCFERMRYDRILFESQKWNVDNISIIGKEIFCYDDSDIKNKIPIVCSDHFGLKMVIKNNKE